MKITTTLVSDAIGSDICRAIGLDPGRVKSIAFSCDAASLDVAFIEVVLVVDEAEGAAMVDAFKNYRVEYRLVPKTSEQ